MQDKEEVALVAVVAGSFGCEALRSVERIGPLSENSTTYRAESNSGHALFLRRSLNQTSQEYLEGVSTLLQLLRAQAVNVPLPISSPQGWVYRYNDDFYTAFEFIEARSYFEGSSQQCELAGATLGRFHRVLREATLPPAIKALFSKGLEAAKFESMNAADIEALARAAAELPPDDPVRGEFEFHASYVAEAVLLRDRLSPLDVAGQPLTLIHYDCHPWNLLVTAAPQVYLVDFDNIRLGTPYIDIGFALHRLVRQGAARLGPEHVRELVLSFFRGYQQENPELPLNTPLLLGWALERGLQSTKSVVSACLLRGNQSYRSLFPKFIRAPFEILFIAKQAGILHDMG